MAKRQMFITKEIADRIPKLYAQDGKGDEAIVHVKWFCPWSQWSWFATEATWLCCSRGLASLARGGH